MFPLVRRTVATLAIAAVGGFAFFLAGLPAAWLAGSAIFVAGASLAGVPTGLPRRLRDALFIVLGVSMGTGIRPETVHRIAEWPVSLALLILNVIAVTAAIYVFLRTVSRWDRDTALFGALPGALSYVVAAAAGRGADVRKVATSQSVRLLFLVAVLPIVIGHGRAAVAPVGDAAGPLDLAILIAVGAAAGFLADRLKVPAGSLVGAFFSSAVLHGAGTVVAILPTAVTIPAFVALGAFVGTRFAGADLASIGRLAGSSVGALAVGLVVAVAGAFTASYATGQGIGGALLAFAPGGIEAMTALAFLLHVDPAYVATHQLVRFIAIALTLPLLLRLLGPPGPR